MLLSSIGLCLICWEIQYTSQYAEENPRKNRGCGEGGCGDDDFIAVTTDKNLRPDDEDSSLEGDSTNWREAHSRIGFFY